VLADVVDMEIATLLGRPPSKGEAPLALTARRELEDRMRRHRWLAMETARTAGALWVEIATAVAMSSFQARHQYETVLAQEKSMGLVDPQRQIPGGPEL
jgi:hypothetical protein